MIGYDRFLADRTVALMSAVLRPSVVVVGLWLNCAS